MVLYSRCSIKMGILAMIITAIPLTVLLKGKGLLVIEGPNLMSLQ